MHLIGRDDLGSDPGLANNTGRVTRVAELDAAIGQWAAQHTVGKALELLAQAQVPAGRIYTAQDIANDPHYRARNMILPAKTRDGLALEVPGIVPKLSATPGAVRLPAPALGQHTDEILRAAGISDAQIAILREKGVIA